MSCWKILHGCYSRLTSVGQHSWCRYVCRSFKTSSKPQPRLLLYGAVAFAWERERISNEHVMECLAGYLNRFNLTNNSSRESADHDQRQDHRVKEPPSKSTSNNSPTSNFGWGIIQWPFTTSPNPSSNDASCTSHESTSSSSSSSSSTTSSSSSTFSWGYLSSLAQNIFTSWSATVDGGGATGKSETNSSSPPPPPPPPVNHKEDEVWFDPEQEKREEFVKEYMHYYRAHSEERMSQLPLVGMAKRWGKKERESTRRLTPGPRLLESIEEATKNKVQRILSRYSDTLSAKRGDFYEREDVTSELSAFSDLSCAGCSLYVKDSMTRDENWFKYHMELECEDDASPVPYHPAEAALREKKQKRTLLLHVLEYLANEIKNSGNSNLKHLKNQFTEGQYPVDDDSAFFVHVQEVVATTKRRYGNTMATAKQICREILSDVLDHFYDDGSGVLPRPKLSSDRRRDIRFRLCLRDHDDAGGGIHTSQVEEVGSKVWRGLFRSEEVKLHVINDEISRVTGSRSDTQLDDLADWEFVTEDSHSNYNIIVYKKLYEDTGLFQYKVRGHYDDITAKDFYEVQVNQELRKTWDTYADKMVTLDYDKESNCKLIHWIMKYPFPMSSREYLFVQRSWISAENDAIVIMNRSSSHPSVPDVSEHVLVSDYFSNMIIKARSRISELGIEFELTYFDCPRVQLPRSCVNWVASTAMPDFMNKIHMAALSRQTPVAESN